MFVLTSNQQRLSYALPCPINPVQSSVETDWPTYHTTRKARDYPSLNMADNCTFINIYEFVHVILVNIHEFVHVILVTKYLVTRETFDPQKRDYYNSNGVDQFAFRNIYVTLRVSRVDLKIFSGLCDAEKLGSFI